MTVLGYDTADQLFPGQSAMGKEVEIDGMIFTVIGVLDKQKQAFGGGKNPQDNQAYLSAVRRSTRCIPSNWTTGSP